MADWCQKRDECLAGRRTEPKLPESSSGIPLKDKIAKHESGAELS